MFGQQEGAEVGYNPRYPGRRSYHPIVAVVAETGACIGARLRPGDTGLGADDASIIGRSVRRVVAHVSRGTKVVARIDSGGDCVEILSTLDAIEGATFVAKMRLTPDLVGAVMYAPTWTTVDEDADGTPLVQVAALDFQRGEWTKAGKSFRVIDRSFTNCRRCCGDAWQNKIFVVGERGSCRRKLENVASNALGEALALVPSLVAQLLSKAIDTVRRDEVRGLRAAGRQVVLTKTRWLLLKRPKNLTRKERVRLRDLVTINLRSVRAYLLKEQFQHFWSYHSRAWAEKFLDRWTTMAIRSCLEPFKSFATTLRKHRHELLNWVTARGQFAHGATEGFNNKARITTRKAYGFRTYEHAEIALYHALGDLPERDWLAHRFC